MEPLQRLPQQPLTGPSGERLVLCSRDAGYPPSTESSSSGRGKWYGSIAPTESSSSGRGKWYSNIAHTDTTTFLQDGSDAHMTLAQWRWRWPAVVLMPEEYSLRVGRMSVTTLRRQLEEYWGQGGIPGDGVENGYQDMWVPAWRPREHRYQETWVPAWVPFHDPYNLGWCTTPRGSSPQLDRAMFSRWVDRECALWLGYFIAENHTLGAVHAWFAAFLGVTRQSLVEIANFFCDAAQVQEPQSKTISHLKFRMSFDVCMEGYDKVVDGIPALPLPSTIITNEQGTQVINNQNHDMFPRRIWDICANTVIPATWFCGPPCPLTGSNFVGAVGVKPVSHAWAANEDLYFISTEANQHLWPIPLPRGVGLEDVRGEMIRLGIRYAWLDVLCLRQQAQPGLAKNLANPYPATEEDMERREQRRFEEWKVDVPTIGAIYSNTSMYGLYRGGPVVIFMNGLGRPFQDEGWASERNWLRRAWTLQEVPALSQCLIAGLPPGSDYQSVHGRNSWPWNCKVCVPSPRFSLLGL